MGNHNRLSLSMTLVPYVVRRKAVGPVVHKHVQADACFLDRRPLPRRGERAEKFA
jgi:hypothetical protein